MTHLLPRLPSDTNKGLQPSPSQRASTPRGNVTARAQDGLGAGTLTLLGDHSLGCLQPPSPPDGATSRPAAAFLGPVPGA